ncbi:hypothetical protein EV210_12120 [Anaerospora hongkongensis]|uniref:Uncharacterized protein n=1 Tax=Anaerospora hongkongensis TaxID=244830 RepID=A0A4R1PME5_9FIRM|nr:hypothetical protein [Anaerospora hongkongensis]TCL32455.1 hypothetical protein EV210_12120 [Anaerospora hongkongensis]
MDSVVVGAFIAVLGWGISHIFTLRAQRKKFLDDIRNNSRIEISKALKEYINWLSLLYAYIINLEIKLGRMRTMNIPIDWNADHEKFLEIRPEAPDSWDWLIEEYRIIFPETAGVRVILSRRQYEIQEAICWFNNVFWKHPVEPDNLMQHRINNFKLLWDWRTYIEDQICLVIDLQIYLQNRALSEIAGIKIPARTPSDPSVCRIITSLNGNLIVVDGQGNEIKHSKQPFSSLDRWQSPIDNIHQRY